MEEEVKHQHQQNGINEGDTLSGGQKEAPLTVRIAVASPGLELEP